jgi:hypothetical protein
MRQSPIDFTSKARLEQQEPAITTNQGLRPIIFSSACDLRSDLRITLYTGDTGAEFLMDPNPNDVCSATHPQSGAPYALRSIVIRVGAEHRVATPASAELQLLFHRLDRQAFPHEPIMAVGVLLVAGTPANDAVEVLAKLLLTRGPRKKHHYTEVMLSSGFDFAQLLPHHDGSYLTYNGSMTSPPCTENVRWVVFSGVRRVDNATLAGLRWMYAGKGLSPRSTQQWNKRLVQQYVDIGHRRDAAATSSLRDDVHRSTEGLRRHAEWTPRSSFSNLLLVVAACAAVGCGVLLYRRETAPVVGIDPHVRRRHRNQYGTM